MRSGLGESHVAERVPDSASAGSRRSGADRRCATAAGAPASRHRATLAPGTAARTSRDCPWYASAERAVHLPCGDRQDVLPPAHDPVGLGEEAVSAEVHAVAAVVDRLGDAADLDVRLEHQRQDVGAAQQFQRRRQAGGTRRPRSPPPSARSIHGHGGKHRLNGAAFARKAIGVARGNCSKREAGRDALGEQVMQPEPLDRDIDHGGIDAEPDRAERDEPCEFERGRLRSRCWVNTKRTDST